ncbi:MAG: ATP-binding protein [Caldilineaceae bacterium]
MRHTPTGGKITIKTGATIDAITIAIQDNGEGIPPKSLATHL